MSSEIVISHSQLLESLRKALNTDDIVYLYGLPSTGKTTIAKFAVEENSDYLYAYIDCNYILKPSSFYIDVLNSLDDQLRTKANRKKIPEHLISVNEFVESFRSYHTIASRRGFRKICIICDGVELLKRSGLIDCFISCSTLPNLKVLLISNESAFDLLDYIKTPTTRMRVQDRLKIIEISPWTKNEVIEFICDDPPKISQNIYKKFVNNVVTIVYPISTKDPLELRTFCQENFQRFLEYYNQEVDILIRKDRRTMSMDEYDRDDFTVPNTFVFNIISSFLDSFKDMLRQKDMQSCQNDNLDTKLVFGTSLLIFAAYIAAHTRPSADKINFVRFQKRFRRKNLDPRECDSATREFTLERLIHIHRSLTELSRGKVDHDEFTATDFSDAALSDVQLLEDLNIIRRTVGDGLDSMTRFKISGILPQIFFERIASQVGIAMNQIFGLPCSNETKSSQKLAGR